MPPVLDDDGKLVALGHGTARRAARMVRARWIVCDGVGALLRERVRIAPDGQAEHESTCALDEVPKHLRVRTMPCSKP